MKIFTTLLALSLLLSAQAVFENTQVRIIEGNDFDDLVPGELWLVLFHNEGLTREQINVAEQTALALRNMIRVASVSDTSLADREGVKAFPTYKAYGKTSSVEFEGEVTPENLVNFIFEQARIYSYQRINVKVPQKKVEEKAEEIEEDDVIVIEDDTVNEILESQDAWFVNFHAPWCDHCKKLAPEWAKLATLLSGEIKVAKIDSSKNTKAHEKFQVKGYPSIKFFPAGDKLDGEWENYDGGRDASSMATWAREMKRQLRPVFLEQLVSQEQFKKNCFEFNGMCMILFVPHILDDGKEGREKYLQTYKDAVLPHKRKPINYFWSQGADQYDFEEIFGLGGAGYPSILTISPKKMLWSKMRGQFTKENLDRFINNLMRGKEQVAPIRRMVDIKTVKPWDANEN